MLVNLMQTNTVPGSSVLVQASAVWEIYSVEGHHIFDTILGSLTHLKFALV